MFMSTFTGTTLQWVSGLPDGHITSFAQFSRLFREQFSINQVKPPKLYDLFDVWQREEEPLKDYLNRFWALMVRLQTYDKDVMVTAFEQGIAARLFSDLLIRNSAETFFKIRERVVAHIKAENTVVKKNGSLHLRQPRSKESTQARPLRINETSTEKRTNSRYSTQVLGSLRTRGT